jgi:anthranilate phosphoribosyltransferase
MSAATVQPLSDAQLALRSCIQKVATGPEYSKDLSFEEAHTAMAQILSDAADPVQTAIFFIALRMKRETDTENRGILQAILDSAKIVKAPVDEVLDIADPYDGHARGLPMAAFIAPVMAALDVPAVCHGLESVGPKYGITHRKVLRAAGKNVDLDVATAAERLGQSDIGWSYVDQAAFAPQLHNLIPLRTRIVKRQALTTVEVLVGPIRGQKKSHILTGFVHKAYPPIYAELARFAGFDSAMIVRGVEGGVVPSLQQPAKLFYFHDRGAEQDIELDPKALGIEQETRAVPLPKDLPGVASEGDEIASAFDADAAAARAAEFGLAALQGKAGPARDSLVYSAAICLHHLGKASDLRSAADMVRDVLDSGKALAHFVAG